MLGVYVRVLLGFQRRRVRRQAIRNERSGCLTVTQRFGGGLNLNVHFHTLVLDGIFIVGGGEPLRFRPMIPRGKRNVRQKPDPRCLRRLLRVGDERQNQ